ncbi:beta-galactosidase [Streptomyces radicis]|uniref:Beta-galactosidase n=1 Tax=Streptomyces radicis TaxID=1750517 RepID=A0A3A9WX75_9ACTN|nr:beta-galactosidase [Streptomyces radicis]RKN12416.1 beta-galactosidase [Streptomyces radicis]RKN27814.1 beta-galactosidase [Streptomyces radicis]
MSHPDRAEERLTGLRHRLRGLAFGGDYNPEQWPKEVWREDVRLMRETGVNLVTVGVFSWGLLEPSPGVFAFGWLDEVMDLLAQADIGVDLATPTAAPPSWLAHVHPETLPVDADGHVYRFGARNQYCVSSPVFRHHAARITERLAERYADHPALAMWHIGNEYIGRACHCPASVAHFRRWLAARYGTVDALNEAWGTAFWGQRYDSFDHVGTPVGRQLSGPNPGQRLDFHRFADAASLECFLAERDIVRRHSPDLPVTTNFMGAFKELDYRRWAADEDVVSIDVYPNTWDPEGQIHAAYQFDLMRSLRGGRPWLVMESATGANVQRRRNSARAAGRMRVLSLQAVARGADSVMFFQWRQSRAGAEPFHSAMLPHGGTRTRTWREVKELGRDLTHLADLVGGTCDPAEVAIVWDWENWWAVEGPNHPSQDLDLKARVLDHYRPLWNANIPVDFVHPHDDLGAYRLVVVPNLYLVDDAGAANLTAFVHGGRHLLMSYFSGIVDEHDRVRDGGHPGAFRDVLGIHIDEFNPLQPGETHGLGHAGHPGTAHDWQDVIELDGAEALATYTEGELKGVPAVTRHRHGAGTATYLGTSPDPDTLRRVVLASVTGAGVTPVLETTDGVEAARRRGADGTEHLFLINHTPEEVTVALGDTPNAPVDLLEPPGAITGGKLRLPPYGAAVLRESRGTRNADPTEHERGDDR